MHEDGTISVSDSYQKEVDPEASWTTKGHNFYYGYKRHVLVESKEGLVLAVSTTLEVGSMEIKAIAVSLKKLY
ncbi:protein of unknown function [Cardinium endosymbiont cEper1 of Encarsia pergandiella]|nr:protein of unknown function [Cardinium endosymbiont cEper1 of Encarsia pergandiella]